jgi:hypothetical protein
MLDPIRQRIYELATSQTFATSQTNTCQLNLFFQNIIILALSLFFFLGAISRDSFVEQIN